MAKLLVISKICFLILFFFCVPLILTASFLCSSFSAASILLVPLEKIRPTRMGQCGMLQDLCQTGVLTGRFVSLTALV